MSLKNVKMFIAKRSKLIFRCPGWHPDHESFCPEPEPAPYKAWSGWSGVARVFDPQHCFKKKPGVLLIFIFIYYFFPKYYDHPVHPGQDLLYLGCGGQGFGFCLDQACPNTLCSTVWWELFRGSYEDRAVVSENRPSSVWIMSILKKVLPNVRNLRSKTSRYLA